MFWCTFNALLIFAAASFGQQCKNDIFFLVDESSSMGTSNLSKVRNAIKNFAATLPIQSDGVRIGVIYYGTMAEWDINLNQGSTKDTVLSKLSGQKFSSGLTNLPAALCLLQRHSFSRNVTTTVFIISSGKTTVNSRFIKFACRGSSKESAVSFLKSKATIWSVAYNTADTEELKAVSNNDVTSVQNENDLLSKLKEVWNSELCQKDKGDTCEAEVTFAIDMSSSMGTKNLGDVKDVIKKYVSTLPIGANQVSVGIVYFSTVATRGLELTDGTSLSSINGAIDSETFAFGKTSLPAAVCEILSGSSNSDLNKKSKFIVFIASGGTNVNQRFVPRACRGDQYIESLNELQTRGHVFSIAYKTDETNELKTISRKEPTKVETPSQLEKTLTALPLLDACKSGEKCRAEVTFVLDTSSSTGTQQLQLIKQSVLKYLAKIKIGSDAIQVGVIFFNTVASVGLEVAKGNSVEAVLDALNKEEMAGGKTNIPSALCLLLSQQESSTVEKSSRFFVFIASGKSTVRSFFMPRSCRPPNFGNAASQLNQLGSVVSIALNTNELSELQTLSGETVTSVKTTDELDEALSSISIPKSCAKTKNCQGELFFLIDESSSMGTSVLRSVQNTILQYLANLKIGKSNIKVAIIYFSMTATQVLQISNGTSLKNIESKLKSVQVAMGKTNLPGAVCKAIESMASDVKNRHTIIIASGRTTVRSFFIPKECRGDKYNGVISQLKQKSNVVSIAYDTTETNELAALSSSEVFGAESPDQLLNVLQNINVGEECSKSGTLECGTDITFVVDISSSMGSTKFNELQKVLVALVKSLNIAKDKHNVGLMYFETVAREELKVSQGTDKDSVIRIFEKSLEAGGKTNLDGALCLLAKNTRQRKVNHKIIIIASGATNVNRFMIKYQCKNSNKEDALRTLSTGAEFFPIAYKTTEVEELQKINAQNLKQVSSSDSLKSELEEIVKCKGETSS